MSEGNRTCRILLAPLWAVALLCAQPPGTPTPAAPSRADILRGAYGPFRANNDLLFYHLDIRVDPEKKFISGKNTIRFKMLKDGTRIQLDLHPALHVDKILLGRRPRSKYERDSGAVFVDFPETLRAGHVYSIDFYYSGNPLRDGPVRRLHLRQGPLRPPWINTACEGIGASIWWPNKDQWRDEVENMESACPFPTAWSMFRTESSWARPTWATATRAGTGSCSTPSTTTMCR